MTKKDYKDYLRDISMDMAKAVKDYAATTNQLSTHITALWTELEYKKIQITELEGSIQDKDESIEYYSNQNSELLDRVERVEEELKACKGTETSKAQYEKRLKAFIGQKVDN